MKHEINPQETNRAFAFEMWLNAPMPMVTLVKTMNVSHLLKLSKKQHIKFNTLMCWCIGKAATETEELYLLPEGGKLFRYDQIAINVVVRNRKGGINSCDIPFSADLQQFNRDYLELTTKVAEESQSSFLDGYMIVGTSAMIQTELDCVVNQYTDKFLNPMVMWGKYRKRWFKATLPVSFQFHHVQMDGGDAARFLERLQQTIYLKGKKLKKNFTMSRNGIVLLYLCNRKSRKSKNSMKGMVELCYDMPQWETYLETSEVAFSEVQKVQLKNELHEFLSDAVLELVEENKLHLMKRLQDFLTNEEIFAGSSQIFRRMPSLPDEIVFDTDMTAFLEEERLLETQS